jgi:hypothetical protein
MWVNGAVVWGLPFRGTAAEPLTFRSTSGRIDVVRFAPCF